MLRKPLNRPQSERGAANAASGDAERAEGPRSAVRLAAVLLGFLAFDGGLALRPHGKALSGECVEGNQRLVSDTTRLLLENQTRGAGGVDWRHYGRAWRSALLLC